MKYMDFYYLCTTPPVELYCRRAKVWEHIWKISRFVGFFLPFNTVLNETFGSHKHV